MHALWANELHCQLRFVFDQPIRNGLISKSISKIFLNGAFKNQIIECTFKHFIVFPQDNTVQTTELSGSCKRCAANSNG
jgi:hypothetical protein